MAANKLYDKRIVFLRLQTEVFVSTMAEVQKLKHFLQYIVIYYLRHGYYFYVLWQLPEGRNLAIIDRSIKERYGVTLPKWQRRQARERGEVLVRYLRFEHTALLIAYEGQGRAQKKHRFFEQERWKDIRITPLTIGKYSLGISGQKPEVRIRKNVIRGFEEFMDKITFESQEKVQGYYDALTPFTYQGILRQKHAIAQKVNNRRKRAALPLIDPYAKPILKKDVS